MTLRLTASCETAQLRELQPTRDQACCTPAQVLINDIARQNPRSHVPRVMTVSRGPWLDSLGHSPMGRRVRHTLVGVGRAAHLVWIAGYDEGRIRRVQSARDPGGSHQSHCGRSRVARQEANARLLAIGWDLCDPAPTCSTLHSAERNGSLIVAKSELCWSTAEAASQTRAGCLFLFTAAVESANALTRLWCKSPKQAFSSSTSRRSCWGTLGCACDAMDWLAGGPRCRRAPRLAMGLRPGQRPMK
jgi:hypothetical protein